MDVNDPTIEIGRGRTVLETASFPCRDEDEVRAKMKELGLVAQTGKRGNVRACARA
jgi:hypothetical protein